MLDTIGKRRISFGSFPMLITPSYQYRQYEGSRKIGLLIEYEF